LWFIFTFCFWIYTAVIDKEGPETEDPAFEDNPLTGWSLYSLYHLGNPIFFNKFHRLVLFYLTVSFLAFFVACVSHANIYDLNQATILWYGLVSVGLTFFPMYCFGIVHRYINELTIQYFMQKEKMLGKLRLETGADVANARLVDQLEDRLFFWEFWYFAIGILTCICLPIAYIKVEQHNAESTFHIVQSSYNCAAWGVALVVHFGIMEPALSWSIGHTEFWKNRGFYYDNYLSKTWQVIRPY
jgi:hypothetical protein